MIKNTENKITFKFSLGPNLPMTNRVFHYYLTD